MQSLYRYRQFNENTIREILKEELYFTSPLEFNDPFDSRPFIDTKASIEEYKKLYKEIMKVQQPSLADKDLDYILERDFDEDKIANQPELLKKSVTEWAIESLSQVYVCCFSEVADSILMYSHYAANHTGVCLEYEPNGDPAFKDGEKVEYISQRPRISYVEGFRMCLDKYKRQFLLTKLRQWEYEKEWRIVAFPFLKDSNKIFDGPFPLPVENRTKTLSEGTLKGIILGCNMSERNIQFIKELVNLKKSNVKLYQARQDPMEYKINILPIEQDRK